MRIVIVDTLYPAFLQKIDHFRRASDKEEYDSIRDDLMSLRFGTSDAYSTNLNLLGHEAQELIVNSPLLQSTWAREMNLRYIDLPEILRPSYISRLPIAERAVRLLPTLHNIFLHQIREIKPDVAYFQDLNFASPSLLKNLKKKGIRVVGQIASPLPPLSFLKHYDLILSSLPNLVQRFIDNGIKAKFLPIAFDERVLSAFTKTEVRDIPVSFVGGISSHHNTTIPLLEKIDDAGLPLSIYGYGKENLRGKDALNRHHLGEAWGLDMYKVLSRSKVTLNRHIDVAENYANNMRLFEATGMGALLLTDSKRNLSDYFEIGNDVLAYDSPDDAAEKIEWALANPSKALEISINGQNRTLNEHNYFNCMKLLVDALESL